MSDILDTIGDVGLARQPKAQPLQAPFPWFGGKSRAAPLIWDMLGRVDNYVEPFAGSLAVLLGAPRIAKAETVNDLDGFITNFWRATAVAPAQVAKHCDWPVNEADLHARHVWLLSQREDLTERLMGDPDFFDAKIAGWWCWGICCWIGSGWCSGNGSWVSHGGKLVKATGAQGVHRTRVHLGNLGQGVHRKRVHLGNLGRGVHRQRGVYDWFDALAARLRRVRVCCGDWQRVCGPSPTTKLGLTGIVLDPPYSTDERRGDLYARDSGTVAADVREWALANGDNPLLRIALCGYDTEHDMPGWSSATWTYKGGFGNQGNGRGRANAKRETIWFSPHCLNKKQGSLF